MRSHTPIKRKKQSTQHKTKSWTACFILSSFALLFTLWLIAVSCIITTISTSNVAILSADGEVSSIVAVKSSLQSSLLRYRQQLHLSSSNIDVAIAPDSIANSNTNNTKTSTLQQHKPTQSKPNLLSRHTNITITSSTRGNLGPPTVLNQNPPGTDWLKDRWQAASDMHGTAIRGSHWVLFDFTPWLDYDYNNDYEIGVLRDDGRRGIVLSKIVLDWETAYANDYRVEVRMDPIENDGNGGDGDWCVLYDNGGGNQHFINNESAQPQFHEASYGQSPGVKQKLPLHIIHTIVWPSPEQQSNSNNEECQSTTAFRYLRVFIRRPARGWGVSLWEVDVYGSVVHI